MLKLIRSHLQVLILGTLMIFNAQATAQTRIGCPLVIPQHEGWLNEKINDASELVLEHYIKPALAITQAGGYLSNPGGSASGLLSEIYENQVVLAKKDVVLLNLVQSIQLAYQRFSTEKLNTEGALALLGAQGETEARAVLGGSAMCVSPADSPVKFQISFYGMRKKECEALTRRLNMRHLAEKVLVNGSEELTCVVDHRGSPRQKWKLFSNYGRNQVTFVFLK